MNKPHVDAVKYSISCLPADHPERRHFEIYVVWRGRDRWAITDGFGSCYSTTGEWDYESLPSERMDDWLDTHRFSLDDALKTAKKIAPLLTCNGWTVERVLGGSDDPSS